MVIGLRVCLFFAAVVGTSGCDTVAAAACATAFTTNSAGKTTDANALCPVLGTYITCLTGATSDCGVAGDALTTAMTATKNTYCTGVGMCSSQSFCAAPVGATTTTYTPWDSSASSSGTLNSLDSSNSNSLHDPASSGSDSSGSLGSSGSTASGSSGSFLELWQWLLVLALLCCCAAALAGMCMKKPKKKVVKKKPVEKPKPVPAPAPAAPLPEVFIEPLMPLPTTSSLIPSYSMVAAPQYMPQYPATTGYPMGGYPATTGYGGYPATTGYGGYGGYPGAVV